DRVNPEGAQPWSEVGQVSRPVADVIVVRIIPPETLQHDLAVPWIGAEVGGEEAGEGQQPNGIAQSHRLTCTSVPEPMQLRSRQMVSRGRVRAAAARSAELRPLWQKERASLRQLLPDMADP